MQPLKTIRQWQLQILENNIQVLTHIVRSIPPSVEATRRDGDTGWTAREVLGHLRDFEALFIERAQLTLEHDNPPLPFPDPDQLAQTQNYNAYPIAQLLDEWSAKRRQFLGLLSNISADADWERSAQHPTRGNFTLHDQLFLTVWHDTNHFAQLAKILDRA